MLYIDAENLYKRQGLNGANELTCIEIYVDFFSYPSADAALPTAAKTQLQIKLFTDVTELMGLKFAHDPGVDGSYFMPESIG